MSNFRFYQERGRGDLILFLTRLGERNPGDFKDADYYRYRIRVDCTGTTGHPAKRI